MISPVPCPYNLNFPLSFVLNFFICSESRVASLQQQKRREENCGKKSNKEQIWVEKRE